MEDWCGIEKLIILLEPQDKLGLMKAFENKTHDGDGVIHNKIL